MKIRNGKRIDKKGYLKVHKESFPNINSQRDSKFFDEKIKKREIFVLEEDGEYVGHICFGKHLLNPPFAASVFIEELAIRQKSRGIGLGTALIGKIVELCKSNRIPAIHLGVGDIEDDKVVKYYEKRGFRKVGWLEDIDPNSGYDCPQFFYAIMVKDWKS